MLEDVTGSIKFITACPDSFTSVTWAQCEPALILKENGPPVVCWRSFIEPWQWSSCSSSNQGVHTGPAAGWCPSITRSSSPRVTSGLLVSPLCSWDCAGRHRNPFCVCTCAILEELDCLCNLIGLQVLPHATSSDKNTSRTKTREGSGASYCLWPPHAKPFPLYGCLDFVSPLHLLALWFAAKQVTLIHSH